jgi:hypothetical protein
VFAHYVGITEQPIEPPIIADWQSDHLPDNPLAAADLANLVCGSVVFHDYSSFSRTTIVSHSIAPVDGFVA